jgi:hypothetical protein
MKKVSILLIVTFLILSLGTLQAQTKIGVGLVLFDRDIISVLLTQLGNFSLTNPGGGMDFSLLLPPSKIMVPISMGSLKLEPEVGWMRYSTTVKDNVAKTETKNSTSNIKFGCGVFAVKPLKKVEIYYGGRVGIVLASSSSTEPSSVDPQKSIEYSTSQTHWYLGPCLGGEYFITDNFSFGGEGQLIYSKIGDPTSKIDGKEDKKVTETSSSLIDTRYMFIFRWYM